MTTIPEIMTIISQRIQFTFDELMKLLIRRTIKPTVTTSNIRHDNVNRYIYQLTNHCLGWTDDQLSSFRITCKRAFTGSRYNKVIEIDYSHFLEFITVGEEKFPRRRMYCYAKHYCHIPYSLAFRQLEWIGRSIIHQINPEIPLSVSSKMSTALLRVKLHELDFSLRSLLVNHEHIFHAYIAMVKLINSLDQSQMCHVIELIAVLSFTNWDDLNLLQQKLYVDALGQCFIDEFNANDVITILLQGDASDVILTASYLYSLLKMLFIVFGFNALMISNVEYEVDVISHNFEGYNVCGFGDEIAIFRDVYPVLINLMDVVNIGGENEELELLPSLLPRRSKINCYDVLCSYRRLETISAYLWKFIHYAYCQYVNCTRLQQEEYSLAVRINDKIHCLTET